MFKRLFKFLQGPEEVETLPFEGSYLDHLLDQTEEEIETLLTKCPEHDPLLLFVVGILRRTMFNAFSPDLREPLVDLYSPGMSPPPPPGVQKSSFMSIEHDHKVREYEEEFEDGDILGIVSESEIEEEDEELVADRSTRQTTEISVEDILEQAAKIKDTMATNATSDIAVSISGEPTGEFDRDDVGLNRVDSPETLLAGRRFLEILVANDTLAPDIQLNMSNLYLVRDHLMSRGAMGPEVEKITRQLLALVEKKFSEAHFGQARILLKLFPTDDLTSLNNDRNIFYEEMILKLGIKRRHHIDGKDVEDLQSVISTISPESVSNLLIWFREKSDVRFHVKRTSLKHESVWNSILDASNRPDLKKYSSTYFPKERWRELGENDDVFEVIVSSVTKESVQEYVITLMGTCYFVLRAVGDTGLEPFLDSFFDWSTRVIGFNATQLMPLIHRGAMTDTRIMHDIFLSLYDEHLREGTEELFDSWSAEDRLDAAKNIFTDLVIPTVGEIAPGEYDLTAFALRRLLKFEYPEPDFGYKVHRLS